MGVERGSCDGVVVRGIYEYMVRSSLALRKDCRRSCGLTKTSLMHIELPYYNGPGFFPFSDAPACNVLRICVICGRTHVFGVTFKVDLIYTTGSVVSLSPNRDE